MHQLSCRLAGLIVLGLVIGLTPVFARPPWAGQSAAPPADAMRKVEISLDPAAATQVRTELSKLGFVGGKDSSPTVLHGRLPQGALGQAAALAGVKRVLCGPVVAASEAAPEGPYHAKLRCRFDSHRLERARQWRDLVRRLEAAGFKKAKGWDGEEFYADTMEGTLSANGASRLHRERHLVTALLTPPGVQLADDPDAPRLVRFHLTPDFGPPNQKEVAEKTKELLKTLGWIPAVGYDNHDHQQLMGWLPGSRLEALLRGKISTVASDREDLVIEMPLPNEANPLLAAGQVVVPFRLHYEPGTKRDDFLKSLEPFKVELSDPDDPRQAEGRYVLGRVSTRLVNQLRQVDNFKALDVDPTGARLRVHPIIRMDVLPEPAGSSPPGEAPTPPPTSRISNELRQHLAQLDEAAAKKLLRVEVLLARTPAAGDASWMGELQSNDLAIEGRVGPLVTGLITPDRVKQLAESPGVSTVRLPAASRAWALPPVDEKASTNLPVRFAPLGRPGEPTTNLAKLAGGKKSAKSVVVASDFRGYEAFVGKQLPAKTQLLDFTSERNLDLRSDPFPDDGTTVGAGTQLALALMAAAPAEELLLVRTAADAPYQIAKVVDAVEGNPWHSAAMDRRERELQHERAQLRERRSSLGVERKLALDAFTDDTLLRTIDNGLKAPLAEIRAKFLAGEMDADAARKACLDLKLSPPYVDTYLNLWQYHVDQARFDRDQADYDGKLNRQQQFVRDAAKLSGADTVLFAQWWPEGHPRVHGEVGMRFLELERGADAPLAGRVNWILAEPRVEGQTWHALFRDANDDGAMEFTLTTDGKRQQANFLAWRPHSWTDLPGAKQPKLLWEELPGGARVEVTAQWSEVHDPAWKSGAGADVYREPLAPVKIVVLKQRDPAEKLLPADAFSVVATSTGLPDRMENDGRTATYQTRVTFTVPEGGGRFAVRLEAEQPASVLPKGVPTTPNSPRWELQPKLMVDVLDAATRAKGRVVFQGANP